MKSQIQVELIDINNLGDNYALVFGRWSLQRETDQPHGLFTLTFEKTVLGWKIIHDHTSSGEQ
ncbi:MAG: hypothetical protein ACWA5R_06375 [bacterium]